MFMVRKSQAPKQALAVKLFVNNSRKLTMDEKPERRVVRTRHVLAVKDLKVETNYYLDKLGFERETVKQVL